MKKLMLIIGFLMVISTAYAVKADPTPAVVQQPDGTMLTVVLHGDEHCNWYSTLDGVLLVQTPKGYYVAETADDGELVATSTLAHNANQRTTNELRMIQKQNKARFFEVAQATTSARRALSIGTATPAYFPHSGSPKALVILVEFKDTLFSVSNPKQTFDDYLNSMETLVDYGACENRNYGSVRQYFSDMSDGQFTPVFDVYGPVRLDSASGYYGKGTSDTYYRKMISEACAAVDDSVDFSQYDANGDGYVDLVYIIYAGYSASVSGNSVDCLWPKSGSGSFGTYDGVSVRRFGINNELNYSPKKQFSEAPYKRVNGIGLFCHEFSHTLGLPDIYPTSSSAQVDNQAMEYWDVMDGGEYTDGGYTPTPYTPWEREVMGWISIESLTDTAQVTLKPLNDGGKAYRIESDNAKEYLIVENVQNTGWATYLYGHGMLVHRICYTKTSVNLGDNPNNTKGKPAVTLVPADSILITSYRVYSSLSDSSATKPWSKDEYIQSHYGDPFPGTTGRDSLVSVTLNNTTLEKPIYNITEEDGVITFDFLKRNSDVTAIALPTTTGVATDERIFTIDGRYVGTRVDALPKGIYIRNGKKIVR